MTNHHPIKHCDKDTLRLMRFPVPFISTRSRKLLYLILAGWAIGISFSAQADDLVPVKPQNTAGLSQRSDETASDDQAIRRDEMRDKWQKMSPEERTERRKAMYDHWKKMTPEEREALRKKMKEHWEKLPPEERKARRKAMREHWDKMSPAERDQFKRDMGKQGEK